MTEQEKTVYEARQDDHDNIDTSRRAMMAGAASGALGALLGLASTPAEATSGIGFVGTAQAQGAAATTPAGAPWWPSRWGADDQAGASNWITPEKVLDAVRLIRTGKIYEMGHVYEAAMPKFGERSFALRIPGGPTGGPFGQNQVIWHDEFLATEIGQVGTQFDGLGHIGVAVKGQDRAEMRFYNGFTAAEISDAYGLKKLGIEHVKPIFTRGMMLDIAAVKGRNLNLGEEVTVADLEAALQRQNLPADAIKPGDALFINTGWGALWNDDNASSSRASPASAWRPPNGASRSRFASSARTAGPSRRCRIPNSNLAFPVHQELITKNGIYIHENLNLTALAAENVSQFVYVMLPLAHQRRHRLAGPSDRDRVSRAELRTLSPLAGRGNGTQAYRVTLRSNCRSMVLPRETAASSASLAFFLPASAASNSSAHTSRNCTMLPRRSPREFSVGSLLVSSSSGVSRYGLSL